MQTNINSILQIGKLRLLWISKASNPKCNLCFTETSLLDSSMYRPNSLGTSFSYFLWATWNDSENVFQLFVGTLRLAFWILFPPLCHLRSLSCFNFLFNFSWKVGGGRVYIYWLTPKIPTSRSGTSGTRNPEHKVSHVCGKDLNIRMIAFCHPWAPPGINPGILIWDMGVLNSKPQLKTQAKCQPQVTVILEKIFNL